MRDISLHILDIIENSIRAKATDIRLLIVVSSVENLLKISIHDNGIGLSRTSKELVDPFYTTKKQKKTGLGLSLWQATCEQSGGDLIIESNENGTAVMASMQLTHLDRPPLGEIAETMYILAMSNPQIRFIFELTIKEKNIHSVVQSDASKADGLKKFKESINFAMASLDLTE